MPTSLRFIYGGHLPVSGLSFPATAESDSSELEVILNPGKEVEIPAGFVSSPNVQSLIENGFLVPVPQEEAAQEEEPEQVTKTRAKNTTPEGK